MHASKRTRKSKENENVVLWSCSHGYVLRVTVKYAECAVATSTLERLLDFRGS